MAASHIRVGTFQYIAAQGDTETLRRLTDYVIARHYPEAASAEQPYRALLDAVVARQADLVARWLLIGFIHGVMNTDSTSIAGETIDYGPCAFMDAYDPATVFSSIDHLGRYAYGNQPNIAQWNLARLAETLLPLLAEDGEKALAKAEESLGSFAAMFHAAYLGGLRRKLGFAAEREGDAALAQDLLTLMAESHADFTLTFRLLCAASAGAEGEAAMRALFPDGCAYDDWAYAGAAAGGGRNGSGSAQRRHAGGEPGVHSAQPHRGGGARCGSHPPGFRAVRATAGRLSRPFEGRPGYERYAMPPAPEERVRQTFCGT